MEKWCAHHLRPHRNKESINVTKDLALLLACCLTLMVESAAQTSSLPKGYSRRNGKLYVSIPVGESTQPISANRHALFDTTLPTAQCAVIPTVVDANSTDDNLYSMSLDVAASLKIQVPIVGGNGTATVNQRMFMRQYKRFATCTAPNADVLEYGQALRATVLYDNTQVEGDVSFPMLVANATVHGQSTSIDFQNTGFTDNTVATPRAAAMASLTNGALTIDNYGTFMDKLNQAMSAADTSSNVVTAGQRAGMASNLVLVGREVQLDPSAAQLPDSLAQAFAIQYIAGGFGCFEAQDDFSKTDQHSRDVVKDTYVAITKNCGAPSDVDKAVASTMLHGMRISKPTD
jgi:hypothetical protein